LDSVPELASNQTVIQHVFLVVIFFFAIRHFNCNDPHFDMSDLRSWLSGQSVALCQQDIVLIQTVYFSSNGKGAPNRFQVFGTQTISFPEPSLTVSERLNPFCKSIVRTNLRSQRRYNRLKGQMHAGLK
jgi:hypothetical protein